MSNSERFPEAWKIYIDCVRKWEETDLKEFPEGWKYGIPNPKDHNEYLYSNCPGKLFMKFKNLFYAREELMDLRKFLWNLEMMEGKISPREYESNIEYINRFY
jgi:hypothetical protein